MFMGEGVVVCCRAEPVIYYKLSSSFTLSMTHMKCVILNPLFSMQSPASINTGTRRSVLTLNNTFRVCTKPTGTFQ